MHCCWIRYFWKSVFHPFLKISTLSYFPLCICLSWCCKVVMVWRMVFKSFSTARMWRINISEICSSPGVANEPLRNKTLRIMLSWIFIWLYLGGRDLWGKSDIGISRIRSEVTYTCYMPMFHVCPTTTRGKRLKSKYVYSPKKVLNLFRQCVGKLVYHSTHSDLRHCLSTWCQPPALILRVIPGG